jgi:hypothetical protein
MPNSTSTLYSVPEAMDPNYFVGTLRTTDPDTWQNFTYACGPHPHPRPLSMIPYRFRHPFTIVLRDGLCAPVHTVALWCRYTLVRMPGTPPPFYLVQPNNTVPALLYTNMTLDYTQVSMYRVRAVRYSLLPPCVPSAWSRVAARRW